MTPDNKSKLAEGRRRRDIAVVYDKLHEGKIGAHWLWCVIEQIVNGVPEGKALADYGFVPARSRLPPTLTNEEITAIVRKAEADWNASADHMNGWHALSDLEKGECIARAMVELRPSRSVGGEAVVTEEMQVLGVREMFARLPGQHWEDTVTRMYRKMHDAAPKPSGEVTAWLTRDDEGEPAMLFFEHAEALCYSGDDEPEPLRLGHPSGDVAALREALKGLLEVVEARNSQGGGLRMNGAGQQRVDAARAALRGIGGEGGGA